MLLLLFLLIFYVTFRDLNFIPVPEQVHSSMFVSLCFKEMIENRLYVSFAATFKHNSGLFVFVVVVFGGGFLLLFLAK